MTGHDTEADHVDFYEIPRSANRTVRSPRRPGLRGPLPVMGSILAVSLLAAGAVAWWQEARIFPAPAMAATPVPGAAVSERDRADGLAALRAASTPLPEVAPVTSVASLPANPVPEEPVATRPLPAATMTAPGPETARPAPAPQEVAMLVERARTNLRNGDVAAARRLMERAASGGAPEALLALAETYDPGKLREWRVRGVVGDPATARDLYARARTAGADVGEERFASLR